MSYCRFYAPHFHRRIVLGKCKLNRSMPAEGMKRSNLGNIESDLPVRYCRWHTVRMSNAIDFCTIVISARRKAKSK